MWTAEYEQEVGRSTELNIPSSPLSSLQQFIFKPSRELIGGLHSYAACYSTIAKNQTIFTAFKCLPRIFALLLMRIMGIWLENNGHISLELGNRIMNKIIIISGPAHWPTQTRESSSTLRGQGDSVWKTKQESERWQESKWEQKGIIILVTKLNVRRCLTISRTQRNWRVCVSSF